MDAIQKAGIPDKFTISFLHSIGFKSTNDRPIVAVLKALNFLNQSGVPTQAYRDYKNAAKARFVLGQRIKEAYADVFLANETANTLSSESLKGIFASLSGKSDSVSTKMAGTFKTLCSLADFNFKPQELDDASIATGDGDIEKEATTTIPEVKKPTHGVAEFHYNIQIHLPITRDISVYNAIFKSLKDHLM